MRAPWPVLTAILCLPAFAESRPDPKAISIYPFTGQSGGTFTAILRGSGLAGATGVASGDAPFAVSVEGAETEQTSTGRGKTVSDLVKLRVQVAPGARPGRYPVRVITRNGVSNALPIHIVQSAVDPEPPGSHENQDSAVAVPALPAVYSGRLSRRGETDYYSFQAQAGQTLTFEVISGLPQIAAAGSAATVANFDPSITIYQAGGSWFDPKRLKRIAYNDEPVWVFGKPTDAYLQHRFEAAGTYLLRIEAFAGQGGPDYGYALKITPGAAPQDPERPARNWEERTWTRRLDPGRLSQLAARGGKPGAGKQIETYRGTPEGAVFKIPGSIEGALVQPGETHRARFHLEKPADIAIEVETPAAAPPYFNPIVRLLNAAGEEVATNVLVGRGACSGAITKSAQAKTLVPLRDTGDYTVEIRDATADLAGADFRYRVQLRPQVPHVGQVKIDTDHLNLETGQSKTVLVVFDREEDFRGAVTVAAESLPPGVSAMAGADFEPDKDPPPPSARRERYVPRTERLVLVLSAAADAPASVQPQDVRLVVRPLVDGKQGEVLSKKSFPLMVVAKP
ncbi:MAG TPA: hypothetical protein VL285_21215 [Bryobacteraceae bacterium]|nr:hypothetical protein [Bryobacteraceae bacterium]